MTSWEIAGWSLLCASQTVVILGLLCVQTMQCLNTVTEEMVTNEIERQDKGAKKGSNKVGDVNVLSEHR